MGLKPEDGALLWEYPWVTEHGINVAQPVVLGESRIFISAAYGHGSVVVELAPKDGKFETRTVWENNRMKNKFSSSVLYQGHIYGFDEAILLSHDGHVSEGSAENIFIVRRGVLYTPDPSQNVLEGVTHTS